MALGRPGGYGAKEALNQFGLFDRGDPRIAMPLADRLTGLDKNRSTPDFGQELFDDLRRCLELRASEIPADVLRTIDNLQRPNVQGMGR